jgi:hypothetical protein
MIQMACRVAAVMVVLMSFALVAQAQSTTPITKRGLLEALRLKGLTETELIQHVQKRGVDFQLTAEQRMELKEAGAGQQLIDVVGANYRAVDTNSARTAGTPRVPPPSGPPAVPAGPPLSKAEIVTLLETGVPAERVEKIVEVRGVSFAPSVETTAEITRAGGNRSLIGAISEKAVAAHGSGRAQPDVPHKGGETNKPPSVAAVKPKAGSRMYVAPMEGDLHGFLSTEIVKKKLPVTLVTDEKEADFIITGASLPGDNKGYHVVLGGRDKNEGSVQLVSVSAKQVVWAGEAGDRSLLWGNLRRGGQRKVADRIVSKMKDELFE